jgi:tetratricopeptide (TPR) repeat protein
MYSKLDHHDKAAIALEEAKDIFDTIGNKANVARCYVMLVDVYGFL